HESSPLSVHEFICFYLFLVPPQPRSSLFPYTTLFRSGAMAGGERFGRLRRDDRFAAMLEHLVKTRQIACGPVSDLARFYQMLQRSEEHTSELQSLRHLVCRLLLEKKKLNLSESISTAH